VQYAADIGQLGGFDETVSLSALGLPDGATAEFSVNDQPPPFSTVLTISGLIGATDGTYDVVIQGEAPSSVRSAALQLTLASGVPDPVTLVEPTDGEAMVSIMPEFAWSAQDGALGYELEVATDPLFSDVAYEAATDATSHVMTESLLPLTEYYWRVRGTNPCGTGAFSDPFAFSTVNRLLPESYDMPNGQTGTYTYFDDTYDGQGDNSEPLAPLWDGLGDLTDGIITENHWHFDPGPYVGWNTADPTITFHFDGMVAIEAVTLYLDDGTSGGGVYPPDDVTIVMGGETLVFEVIDPPGSEPFGVTFDELDLAGTVLELTLADYSSDYMMLCEVEFHGLPVPDSCPADLNADGAVNVGDLLQLLGAWGSSGGPADLDDDGLVNVGDLLILLGEWGACP
jgi:hypothetical protein